MFVSQKKKKKSGDTKELIKILIYYVDHMTPINIIFIEVNL